MYVSRKRALEILKTEGCPKRLVEHCLAVAKYARKFSKRLKKRGIEVNLHDVEIGALLHDIGRSKSHGIDHGVIGGEILRDKYGLRKYARIAETHIGAGITKSEARELGLPAKDYIPKTLEEKIIAYIDDRVAETKLVSEKEALEHYQSLLGKNSNAFKRIKQLFKEMSKLYGGEFVG